MTDPEMRRQRARIADAQERSARAQQESAQATALAAEAQIAAAHAQQLIAAQQGLELRRQAAQRRAEQDSAARIHEIEVTFRTAEGLATVKPLDAYLSARTTELDLSLIRVEAVAPEQRSGYAQLSSAARVLRVKLENTISAEHRAVVDEFVTSLKATLLDQLALKDIHERRIASRTLEWALANLSPSRRDYADAVTGCGGVLVALKEQPETEAEWTRQLDLALRLAEALPDVGPLTEAEWSELRGPQAQAAFLDAVRACAHLVEPGADHPMPTRPVVEKARPYWNAVQVTAVGGLAARAFVSDADWSGLLFASVAASAFYFAWSSVRRARERELTWVATMHGVRGFLIEDANKAARAVAVIRRMAKRDGDVTRQDRLNSIEDWMGTAADAAYSLARAEVTVRPTLELGDINVEDVIAERRRLGVARPRPQKAAQDPVPAFEGRGRDSVPTWVKLAFGSFVLLCITVIGLLLVRLKHGQVTTASRQQVVVARNEPSDSHGEVAAAESVPDPTGDGSRVPDGASPPSSPESSEPSEPTASPLVLRVPVRIYKSSESGGRSFDWATASGASMRVNAVLAGSADQVIVRVQVTNASGGTRPLISFVCPPGRECEGFANQREDGKLLIRLEVLSSDIDEGASSVVAYDMRDQIRIAARWDGTARQYWSRATPAWVQMRRSP